MEGVEWYYVFSQRYYPFHFYLEENIPPVFKATGVFVDQKVFDEHLYRHQGEHFFSRITVKIEVIIKLLEEKIAAQEKRPFIFTDCDILIGPTAFTDLMPYTEKSDTDILFQREYTDISNRTVNPGVSLIWPNERNLCFWKAVFEDINSTQNLDMISINKLLPKYDLQWDFFNTDHVCSSITTNAKNYKNFSVYHILCGASSREVDIGDKMFEASNNGQNMEKYINMTIEKFGGVFM